MLRVVVDTMADDRECGGAIERNKRPPTSPLDSDGEFKKLCERDVNGGANGGGGDSGRELLSDVTIMKIVDAVSSRVKADMAKELSTMRGEVVRLRAEIAKKDEMLADLRECLQDTITRQEKIERRQDEAEQYSRRNCVRIHGIPETDDENTDNIIVKLCGEIGADIFQDNIDRSHRVGRRSEKYDRPILCKFTSHKSKLSLLRRKKKLKDIDVGKLFGARTIFVNEDLTKQRAEVASRARALKRDKEITDCWTTDGIIFVKALSGSITRVTTMSGLLNVQP